MTPPSPLRLLMTADAIGGVWTYAAALSRELCRRSFKVTLVTLGPEPRKDQLREIQGIEDLDFEPTDLALEWMDPEGRDFRRTLDQLSRIERRTSPDVVHLNGYREAAGDWNTPAVIVAHSCVRSWWLACRGEEPSEARWLEYIANVQAGLAAADRWVAPTAAFRDVVQRLYEPPTNGHVIWNGIGGDIARSEKQPFILGAGRLWDEAKNLSMLTHIAGRVPWPIRIAGRSTAHGGAEGSAPLRGVEHLGELSRDALRAVMHRASILVAPAIYEPFGLTVLEAARAGCALVLSDLPGFRELWDGAALFVDPRDDLELQATLAHLTRNDSQRRQLQRRARHRAQRYSLAAMAEGYVGLYHAIADCAVRPRRAGRHKSAEASA